jgi:heavy metal translocating P-type ATPase
MSEIVKSASRRMEQSIESVLTHAEQKVIAWRMGSVLLAGGIFVAGKIYQISYPGYDCISGIIMFTGALIASSDIFRKALTGFVHRDPEYIMEQLVGLALFASISRGNYEIAILIPLIMSLVHFLEERSILGAKSAIEGLKTLQAKEACLITTDGEMIISTGMLSYGDTIRIKPGEMIPVDGEIIEGNSSVDQSSMTGETIPVDVGAEDRVFAGTINIQGVLNVKVLKKVDETSLSKIVELLHKTEQSKTSTMRIIERYSSYYLPFVIVFAAGVFLITQNMDRVIAVLVVSCPCAQILVSSTAMIASLAVSSRNGILLKNSRFLEVLGDVKTVIFDKTGTLTIGNLNVVETKPLSGVSIDELLASAAGAAWASNHPVSQAVVKAASGISFEKGNNVQESAGMGVIAETSAGKIILGKKDLLQKNNLSLPFEPDHFGPVVWAACNEKILGYFLLADHLRHDAAEIVESIRSLGIERVIMVTGDRRESTATIGSTISLDEIFSECLPSAKLEIVEQEKRKTKKIMMIGDGINDALALSEADVGVAMGAMGSDIAVQSADIALMGNELKKIPFMIQLSRAAKTVIYQNIVIASLSSITMLILASLGIITPLAGAFLHNAGAFLVLANSARLLKFDTANIKKNAASLSADVQGPLCPNEC